MALGDVFRFTIQGVYEQQTTLNVLHYQIVAVAGTGATTQQIINSLIAIIEPDYLAVMNVDFATTGYRLQQVAPVVGDPIDTVVAPPNPGVVVGDGQAAFIAAVISWRTGIADRRHRGRTFLPGRSESDSVDSLLNVGAINDLVTLATTMQGPIQAGVGGNTSDLQLAVRSVVGNVTTPVENFLVRNQLATMRSRKLGRGI